MITSMTGYGRGDGVKNGYEAVVEVRSLNHRFLDVTMRLPRSLGSYEESVKEIIKKHVERGRVNIAVTLKNEIEPGTELRIDIDAATKYKRLLDTLQKKLGLEGPVTIDHLLHFSEVLTVDSQDELPEEVWHCVQEATNQALKNLNEMRQREGQEITNDLRKRVALLEEKTHEIETRTSSRRQEEFQKLYNRLADLVKNKELDRDRLELEVALLADRVDVTEECIRFHSHNTLFVEAIDNDEPSGRKLNFLLQEMNREANTIGAKANDSKIAHLVVDLKEEIEKLREQVQNIE